MPKILLIDDDSLLVRMYERKFKLDGSEVETAFDGKTGLAKAAEFKPNLILLDIMMPEMNGLEVLEKLKADEGSKAIPIILLTNLGGSQEDIDRGLGLGAVAYLVKADYTPAEVVAKVKEILAGYIKELPKPKPTKKELSKKKEQAEVRKKVEEEAKGAAEELKRAQEKAGEAAKKLKEVS